MEKNYISSNLLSKSINKFEKIHNKAVKLIYKEFGAFSKYFD